MCDSTYRCVSFGVLSGVNFSCRPSCSWGIGTCECASWRQASRVSRACCHWRLHQPLSPSVQEGLARAWWSWAWRLLGGAPARLLLPPWGYQGSPGASRWAHRWAKPDLEFHRRSNRRRPKAPTLARLPRCPTVKVQTWPLLHHCLGTPKKMAATTTTTGTSWARQGCSMGKWVCGGGRGYAASGSPRGATPGPNRGTWPTARPSRRRARPFASWAHLGGGAPSRTMSETSHTPTIRSKPFTHSLQGCLLGYCRFWLNLLKINRMYSKASDNFKLI